MLNAACKADILCMQVAALTGEAAALESARAELAGRLSSLEAAHAAAAQSATAAAAQAAAAAENLRAQLAAAAEARDAARAEAKEQLDYSQDLEGARAPDQATASACNPTSDTELSILHVPVLHLILRVLYLYADSAR